ncbi:Sua5/YciO/YrdC/YwlC family protein [Streptomyces minutiscleroticus]|uniref:YrdC-like domain-containing protein n=1 Tax=Streptomyces minutiscleroticus TaxID=68238 RepID=A0A918NYR2_9ACTN|nr:hypothetical protein [Streptomyces minutiscleroticus]GGY06855.1 hypothetical protein GCM10010358_70140 [Streptomyces minutiscleroticus]
MSETPKDRADRAPVSLVQAGRALRDGTAVVVPNAAPLTHVVTAPRARSVNEAKGRPVDQPVALWAHHPDTLRALEHIWKLGTEQSAKARWLLQERFTVLVPVQDGTDTPDWASPAIKDGWMLMFGARWQPLRPLLDEHPVLYVSSANRTGHPPAATTADALAMFPATVPVLALPEPEEPDAATAGMERRATTTVRLHPDGRMELHRHGAQDQHYATPAHYLQQLQARYTQAAPHHATGRAPSAASSVPSRSTAELPEG